MLQQLNHLFFAIVNVDQVLVCLANLVALFELFFPVLLTHILSEIVKVTARYIDHLFLTDRLASSFWLNFGYWSLLLHSLLTVQTCFFFAVLFLRVPVAQFTRRHVFFIAIIVCFVKVCDVLLVFKVEKGRIIMLLKVLLWGFVLRYLFYFQLSHFLLCL